MINRIEMPRLIALRSPPILAALLVTFLAFFYTSLLTNGMIGFGTLQSKFLIDVTGVTDSSLLVVSSSQSEAVIVGTAPLVTTTAVTSTGEWGGTTHATLNGNMTDLQGASSAQGYFQWGYTAATMTVSTTPQTLSSTGAFSAAITGFDNSQKVYYRAVVESDGIRYASPVSFIAASGVGGFLLRQLLSLVIALGVCLTSLKFAGPNPAGVMVSVLVGLIAFVFALSVLS